jgi:hypothetical protein
MAQASDDECEKSTWREFATRHAGQPFIDCLSLYSLTESIIDAIQAEVPCFFSKDQERFERDLAKTASFGFFCHRVLGFSDSRASSAGSLHEGHARSG